jgi:hypothetical protein
MVYTEMHIHWGLLSIEENRKPEILLTGPYLPDNICLINSKYINSKYMGRQKPQTSKESYIPTEKILGYHLMGHEKEIPAPEDNRIKKQINILLGNFKISASIWTGPTIDIQKHLEMNKSQFMDVYDASISIPNFPESKPMKANKMTIRKDGVVFLVE